MSAELPVGWALITIQEVVNRLEYGYTAKAERRSDGPRFLRITDIEDGRIDWASVPRCNIDETVSAKYRLRHGDIVFARTGSIDKACMVRNPPQSVFASYLIRGRPIEVRMAGWLDAFVGSFEYRAQAAAASAGIGRANINAKSIGRIRLRLPPLPEQCRIVEALASYFTRLDAAVTTLERVQRNLKRYRASVLKAAVEGRLVPTEAELARAEGRDYEPASVLLDSILAERRRRWEEAEMARMKAKGTVPKDDKWKAKYEEPVAPDTSELPELPEGWCWAGPDQIAAHDDYAIGIGPFGSNLKVSDYRDEGVPLIFVRNIRAEAFDSTHYVAPDKAAELTPHIARGGDLLITKMGEPPGDAAIYPIGSPDGVFTADCIRLRNHATLVWTRYLLFAVRSNVFRDQIIRVTKGVAQKKVSLARFKRLALPFAPLAEQMRVADEVDRLLSVADATVDTATRESRRLARLRQSILKWAFEGCLVDQNPTDEPASALLERIRAGRASADTEKPKRPGRRKARSPKA